MEILGLTGQLDAGATSAGEGLEVVRGLGSGQGQEGPGRRGIAASAPGLARGPLQCPPAAPWNFRAAAASASRGAGAATRRRTAPTAATSTAAEGPARATTRPAPAARTAWRARSCATACPTAPTPRTRARTPAVSARRPPPGDLCSSDWAACQLESGLGLGHRPPLTFLLKLSLKTRALQPRPRVEKKGASVSACI